MQLKEFSLISPVIQSAEVFKAIETVISPDAIEQTLGKTKSIEERKRKLPPDFSPMFSETALKLGLVRLVGKGTEKQADLQAGAAKTLFCSMTHAPKMAQSGKKSGIK